MSETQASDDSIDELAADIERRIKRNEKLLASDDYNFEDGRIERLSVSFINGVY